MTLQEFSDACHVTNNYSDEAINGGILITGITEEAGEVAGQYKRKVRDDGNKWTQERVKKTVLEIMDTMWYCVEQLRAFGYSPDKAAEELFAKLNSRQVRNCINGEGSDR